MFLLPGSASPPSVDIEAFSEPNNSVDCKKNGSPGPNNLSLVGRAKFLDMAVDAAMNQALDALNYIKLESSKCQNLHEKAALSDCWKFYELTISQQNQTLNPNLKSTSFDIQTWLSAVLTNLGNCKTSLTELNVRNSFSYFLYNNVSEIISNSLAINDESMEEKSYQMGFPSWLSDGDLRLLQKSCGGSRWIWKFPHHKGGSRCFF